MSPASMSPASDTRRGAHGARASEIEVVDLDFDGEAQGGRRSRRSGRRSRRPAAAIQREEKPQTLVELFGLTLNRTPPSPSGDRKCSAVTWSDLGFGTHTGLTLSSQSCPTGSTAQAAFQGYWEQPEPQAYPTWVPQDAYSWPGAYAWPDWTAPLPSAEPQYDSYRAVPPSFSGDASCRSVPEPVVVSEQSEAVQDWLCARLTGEAPPTPQDHVEMLRDAMPEYYEE